MKEFYIALTLFIGMLLGLVVYLYWSVVSEDRENRKGILRNNNEILSTIKELLRHIK